MTEWHIFIDETGQFHHPKLVHTHTHESYIVAALIQGYQIPIIFNQLKIWSQTGGIAEGIKWTMEGFHGKDLKQNPQLAKIYPELFQFLRHQNTILYRSQGHPAFPIDPEDSWYRICLCLIVQIAKERLKDHEQASLDVHLPSRNYWMFSSDFYNLKSIPDEEIRIKILNQRENLLVRRFEHDLNILIPEYYSKICIHGRYSEHYDTSKSKSKYHNNALQALLSVADACVEWCKMLKSQQDIVEPSSLIVKNFQENFSPSKLKILHNRVKDDAAGVFVEALEYFMLRDEEQDWLELIKVAWTQCSKKGNKRSEILAHLVYSTIEFLEISVKNKAIYSKLQRLCEVLESLGIHTNGMEILIPKWQYAIVKTKAQIEAHQGKISDATAMNQWWYLVQELDANLFDDALTYQKEWIEVGLFRAQQYGINTIDPDIVVDWVEFAMKKYRSFLPKFIKVDRHFARLCGTFAQAKALQGGLAQSPLRQELYNEALQYFQYDLEYCPTGGWEYEHALGYLSSIAFHLQDEVLLTDYLQKETGSTKHQLLDLAVGLGWEQKYAFKILHRIYLIQIKGIESCQNIETLVTWLEKLNPEVIDQHPWALIFKWLAYLYRETEYAPRLLKLLVSYRSTTNNLGFALNLIDWVNAHIAHLLGDQSVDIRAIEAKLEGPQGIPGTLSRLKFWTEQKYGLSEPTEMKLSQWINFLPFHYC